MYHHICELYILLDSSQVTRATQVILFSLSTGPQEKGRSIVFEGHRDAARLHRGLAFIFRSARVLVAVRIGPIEGHERTIVYIFSRNSEHKFNVMFLIDRSDSSQVRLQSTAAEINSSLLGHFNCNAFPMKLYRVPQKVRFDGVLLDSRYSPG
jgi:hypothetical protein